MSLTQLSPDGAHVARSPERSLVMVAGSGRSGTSLVSGILQRLGCHVPVPEVPADPSNPRGFAESQWVIDMHTRLLQSVGVQVSDARPSAWGQTAKVCVQAAVHAEVQAFLAAQFERSPAVLIKDPRLSWFLPVWRRAAAELGVTPRVIIMLRHPAAVVVSKQRSYGGRQGEAARAAGWVNQTLFTERATRDTSRVLVRYDHLLEDWPSALGSAGESLDLAVVRDASAQAIRRAHDFVDASLDRSRPDWGDLEVPTALQAQAEQVWQELTHLPGVPGPAELERLDALRAAYAHYYDEAEAVAFSSIVAERWRAAPVPRPSLSPSVRRVVRRIPPGVRHAVPRPLRTGLVRALAR